MELEFDNILEENENSEFLDILDLIPDDYFLLEIQATETSNYALFEDPKGFWISLHQTKGDNSTFAFDSEKAEINDL